MSKNYEKKNLTLERRDLPVDREKIIIASLFMVGWSERQKFQFERCVI